MRRGGQTSYSGGCFGSRLIPKKPRSRLGIPIKKADYEKRLVRISDIFKGIATHADQQALTRCPYKNRFDQCTAKFACGYKRKPNETGGLPICGSDDRLDYRTAWETDPKGLAGMKMKLEKSRQTSASISCGERVCRSTVGKTIFGHADELEVKVPTSCGRAGTCHECIVEIKNGMKALSGRTESEMFLSRDYRLACQATVEDSRLEIEFELLCRTRRVLTDQIRRSVELDPMVTHRGDHVYYGDKEVDDYRGHVFGVTLDLGTTTVVLELFDLETGESVYAESFENPQRFGGSDIMSRISYDAGPFRGELHAAIISTFNTAVREMCVEVGISRHEIYEILLVGNSAMRELFFGIDVQSIGQRPYKSTVEKEWLSGERDSTVLRESARKLNLVANKNAVLVGAPIIASHVGGDITSDLVAIDMASKKDVVMLVDIGTNTEVVIGHGGRLMAASCPAGPAFEGGLVRYGMPGCVGAIESVRYVGGTFQYDTIGGGEPDGICGSGYIDLLAELRRNGLMTAKGVFQGKANEVAVVSGRGITLSRQDASELAQAKAANFCGQVILMRKFGVVPKEISTLYLSGAFANYVSTAAAVDIGFLAPVPEDRVVKLGNGAAQGAREMLFSRKKREIVGELIKKVEHVELETTSDFFEVFVEGCQFKPMNLDSFS